jgi:hypothetical protein
MFQRGKTPAERENVEAGDLIAAVGGLTAVRGDGSPDRAADPASEAAAHELDDKVKMSYGKVQVTTVKGEDGKLVVGDHGQTIYVGTGNADEVDGASQHLEFSFKSTDDASEANDQLALVSPPLLFSIQGADKSSKDAAKAKEQKAVPWYLSRSQQRGH